MKKINLATPFVIVFFFLIIIYPEFVRHYTILDTIWKVLRVTLFTIILLFYLKNKTISKFFLIYILFFGTILLSTIIHQGDVTWFLSQYIPYLAIFMYCEMLCKDKKNVIMLLKCLTYLLIVLYIINIITIYKFPNGIWSENTYFLGLDNIYAPMIVFGTAIMLLYAQMVKKGILFQLFCCILSFMTLFLTNCATGLVGISIFIIGYLLRNQLKNIKMFQYKNYLFLGIILTYLIVFLRLQEIFSFIITDVFGKSMTLSLRTLIWDTAIYDFKNNILFGIGYSTGHSHCTILHILKIGGILAFAVYLIFLFMINKKTEIYRKNIYVFILSLSMLSYFIMAVDEYYFYNYFFIVVSVLL